MCSAWSSIYGLRRRVQPGSRGCAGVCGASPTFATRSESTTRQAWPGWARCRGRTARCGASNVRDPFWRGRFRSSGASSRCIGSRTTTAKIRCRRRTGSRTGWRTTAPRLGAGHHARRPYLNNVMLRRDRPEVAAFVDWEMCTIGDPLLDLGWMLVCWPTVRTRHASRWRWPYTVVCRVVGNCSPRTCRRWRPTERLDWYVAMACFKLGDRHRGHLLEVPGRAGTSRSR